MSAEKEELRALRAEIAKLRAQLKQLNGHSEGTTISGTSLDKHQAERYARHIVLRSFGLPAQERVCQGSALIVGAGGLGSPCALYLVAAGIGLLGIADHDTVSTSNLHRQIAHSDATVGTPKATSAAATCNALNPRVKVTTFQTGVTPKNAQELVRGFDVVVDCSDNAPTRYLVSDAAVLEGKPLVSGAAVGTDGQLTVYNHQGGPCYRCLFPECPAVANCARCDEAGVLGPVPGVIGTLQALEVIKILSGVGEPLSRRLLLYDGLSTRFSTVQLRNKVPDCFACGHSERSQLDSAGEGQHGNGKQTHACSAHAGHHPAPDKQRAAGNSAAGTRSQQADVGAATSLPEKRPFSGGKPLSKLAKSGGTAGFDYAAFAGVHSLEEAAPPVRLLTEEQRVSCIEFKERLEGGDAGDTILLDVRPRELYDIAHLQGAIHMPMELVASSAQQVKQAIQEEKQDARVLVMCRRGNNSQVAASALIKAGLPDVEDLKGGLHAWAQEVDDKMPVV